MRSFFCSLCLISSVFWFEPSARADKTNASALHREGVAYAEKGDWTSAVASLEKAIALEPDNIRIITSLSLVYAEAKDYRRALVLAEKATRNGSQKPGSWRALGLAQEGLGEEAKAISAYRQGLQVDPKNQDLFVTLGNLYAKKRDFEAALKVYQDALEADPGNLLAYSNSAYLYEEMGDFAKALEFLELAAKTDPEDAVTLYDLGKAHARREDLDKAIEYYNRSLEKDPKLYEVCIALAMTYEKKRDLKKAAETYTRALSLTDDPKLKEVILKQITRSE